jgi:PAS domain S-box-containing protein
MMHNIDSDLNSYILDILDQAQNGVVITDPNQKGNPVIYVNDITCKRFGYKRENFLGNNCKFLQAQDKDQPQAKDIKEAIKELKPITRVIRNYTKKGDLIYNEITISPIFDKSKKIKYFLGIQKDLTNEILLKKENEELQKDKLNNIQLNTIGKLSGGISHEINTPLTVIKGNLEMLKSSIEESCKDDSRKNMLDDLHDIETNINRIKNIAESMREIAGTEYFSAKKINLYRSLIFSLRLTHHKSKKITNIKIQNKLFNLDLDRDYEKVFIKADHKKLEHAFMAIIDNALDELEAKGEFDKNLLEINILEYKNKVEVVFQDNAGGVSPEILPNIFEPFKGCKKHRGLGIGLCVVKKIMDEHQFDIKFENGDRGAMITITIDKIDF